MTNGEEILVMIDGKEIASCNSVIIDVVDKEWRPMLDHAKDWTFKGEVINSDIFQYYYRRGDRYYFRNCYGDKLWVETSDNFIHGILSYGELTKMLLGDD